MVGKICTVCKRCSYIDKNLSFFQYPSDQKRRYKWLQAVNRMDLTEKVDNFKTRGNHRICEVHFEKKYILQCEGKKCLTKDAYPTLLLDSSLAKTPTSSNSFAKRQSPKMKNKEPTWGECRVNDNIKDRLKRQMLLKVAIPRRKSVRQEEMALKNVKNVNIKIQNEHLFNDRVPSPPSPESPIHFQDVSQFCESIIKVSKGTQTFASGSNNMKVEGIKTENNKHKMEDDDKDMFLLMCKKFLPPNLCEVVKWQLSPANSEENINLKLFATYLYYSSNAYNLFRAMLSLPTKESLKYFLFPKSTRLSESFINAFRYKVSNMSTKERICSISVGSVMLSPNLYYDIKHDRIIGLHDVNGEQNICVAKYAIVIMVQGILVNWKQPISYGFISEYKDFPEISTWIDETLVTLLHIGLDVRVFVSDPKSEFLYASESTSVSPDKTYFTVNGTEIFYTYDSMQLLKIVKNNSKSCNYHYAPDCNVTNDDDFFNKLNNLCEMLNSKTQFDDSPYKRAFSNKKEQTDFLNEMLLLFQKLKVVRKADGVDVTENMKFINDFQIAINSLLQLFEEFEALDVKYLRTSRLNHDNLNEFFSKLKSLNVKEECTPRQFNKAFVRSFVFNMLKKPKGNSNQKSNLGYDNFSQQLFTKQFRSDNIEPLLVNTTDYRQGLPDKNCFVYVCGYCYLKCIQQHSCPMFKVYLNICKNKQKTWNLCSVSLDLNVNSCEMMPPEDFTDYLMLLETKFREYLKENAPIHNIGRDILKELNKYSFRMPCPCFPIDYLKTLFVRVRLFYTVRKNNKLLKRKKGLKTIKGFCL